MLKVHSWHWKVAGEETISPQGAFNHIACSSSEDGVCLSWIKWDFFFICYWDSHCTDLMIKYSRIVVMQGLLVAFLLFQDCSTFQGRWVQQLWNSSLVSISFFFLIQVWLQVQVSNLKICFSVTHSATSERKHQRGEWELMLEFQETTAQSHIKTWNSKRWMSCGPWTPFDQQLKACFESHQRGVKLQKCWNWCAITPFTLGQQQYNWLVSK